MGQVTVQVRYLCKIKGRYYWQPGKHVRALGFATEALGADRVKAIARAEELNAAVDQERGRGAPASSIRPGSVAALIAAYRKSPAWEKLKTATREAYDIALGRIERTYGADQVAAITEADLAQSARKARASMKPGMARLVIVGWKNLMRLARDERWIASNPAKDIPAGGTRKRDRVWTDEELATLYRVAAAMGRPSIALAVDLMYDSGQRPVDVLSLMWSRWTGHAVVVRQRKTGKMVAVRVSPELAARINALPRTSTHIIVSETTGRPYRRAKFSTLFRDLARRNGLPEDLQLRDLRRTALTEAGEVGGTDDQIRAVSGHTSRETVGVYVVPNTAMADAVQKKRFRARSLKRRKAAV